MGSRILAIYDLSGIQKFIFSTNKMKEIIGGSAAVHNALFFGVPDVLKVDRSEWKTGDFSFGDGDKAKIVYIGGGNALVMFADTALYNEATKKLGKKVFTISGGAVSLFSACIELDENASLSENQKKLMAKLDEAKKAGSCSIPVPAFPVIACDNNNYQPLAVVGSNRFTTTERYAKLISGDANEIFKDIKPDNIKFQYDFESTRKEDEKNYQAIIHIDGNTMGIKIRGFVDSLTGDIYSQMTKMRDLSVTISNLYNSTLKETVAELYSDVKGAVPFRPIVADGDDITVMIEAEKSFKFVKLFINNLENKTISGFGAEFKPTAAAGIAFVKLKFPFSVAYDLAEACCKNAKSKTIERYGGAEKFLSSPVSSMDYQVCYSNISENLKLYRADNYYLGDFTLIRRPYVFDNSSKYSFSAFETLCEETTRYTKPDKAEDPKERNYIARSKLKGLRNAYGISAKEAELYCNYIYAHAKTPGECTVAEKFKNPFNEDKESLYFDYFDIMDIIWKEKD